MSAQVVLEGMFAGEAIREYLSVLGRGNPYGFFKLYRQVKETTSYQAVRRYFWILKEIGLIQPVGYGPGKKHFKPHLYRVTPGKMDDPAWWHPQGELYKGTLLGKAGYAKLRSKGLKPKGGRNPKYR